MIENVLLHDKRSTTSGRTDLALVFTQSGSIDSNKALNERVLLRSNNCLSSLEIESFEQRIQDFTCGLDEVWRRLALAAPHRLARHRGANRGRSFPSPKQLPEAYQARPK